MKTFLFFLFFCWSICAYQISKKIYIIPPGGYENEKLFDISDQYYNRDNCIKHFFDLRSALARLGYQLQTARITDDLSDAVFILTSGILGPFMVESLKKYSDKKIFAFIWEPTTVELISYDKSYHDIFDKIFIMDDEWVDGEKYIKLYYPHPSVSMIDQCISFDEKKLCTLISSFGSANYPYELYSERKKAIRFFQQYPDDFIFYGKGWNKNDYPNYGGPVVKKLDVLKYFKFSICFENTSNMNGYISEKIFDSFQAGCIPVYYGAPNVAYYIPKECFIDFRDFENYQQLYDYLVCMSQEEYAKRLWAIEKYLNSDQAFHFTFIYFIDQVLKQLFMKYDRSVVFDTNEIERLMRLELL